MKNIKAEMGFGFGGEVSVAVLNPDGTVAKDFGTTHNLVLDQGLNRLSSKVICDLFSYAVKGNDADLVTYPVTGTYTLNSGAATVTRNSGARDFTSADIGRLIVSSTLRAQAMVDSIVSPTVVNVVPVGLGSLTAYAADAITIYSVSKVGMDTEDSRTNSYGQSDGDNSTVYNSPGQRTFKRTFIFPAETAVVETPASVLGNWTGTSFVKASGARSFTAADEGKYIEMIGTPDYAKIVNYVNATSVTVDRPPSTTRTGIAYRFYGYHSYSHIGFSDTSTPGDNLNILVHLVDGSNAALPVTPLGENPETAGQQVRVVYTCTIQFGPSTIVSGSAGITDPTNSMSASKAGAGVMEAATTSIVLPSGETSIDSIGMEPASGGHMALSPSSAALVPLGTGDRPDRSVGAAIAIITPEAYTPGQFSRLYTGTFGIGEANAVNWRSLGTFDIPNQLFLYTFLFNTNQKKLNSQQLTLRFRKAWNRLF